MPKDSLRSLWNADVQKEPNRNTGLESLQRSLRVTELMMGPKGMRNAASQPSAKETADQAWELADIACRRSQRALSSSRCCFLGLIAFSAAMLVAVVVVLFA